MHPFKKKLFACILVLAVLLSVTSGCTAVSAQKDDIIILFTNDVHCGIDENIGYAGLAAYKNELKKTSKYVTLVDCGDFLQGDTIGVLSKGAAIPDILNAVGYDFVALGNHEFDFGVDVLCENLSRLEAKCLCCNVSYTGSGENKLKSLLPYAIVQYGKAKVAFIGVSTPETITNSTPKFFKEDDEYVYSFASGNDGKELYDTVQKAVNTVKTKGADYVVVLGHLGNSEQSAPFRSTDIIENTTGIDVLLDGHSHDTVPCSLVKDKSGKNVLLSQTGTKLSRIGQLTITSSGLMTVSIIDGYEEKDAAVEAIVAEKKKACEDTLSEVIGRNETLLSINNEDGVRLVRMRETAIGDLFADALRVVTESQIGLANGGGIRADIKVGDVTYADLCSVLPFNNTVCSAWLTGSQILDLLENAYRNVVAECTVDGKAIGESGDFMQVSGIRFTIDTNVESSVVLDGNEMFIEVTGERRVKNVEVLEKHGYAPIDPEKEYLVASIDYILLNGGAGTEHLLKGVRTEVETNLESYIILAQYIKQLNGSFSKYKKVDDRITILK